MELRGMRRTSARVVHRVGRTDDGVPRITASLATRPVGEHGGSGGGPRWRVGVGDGPQLQVSVAPDGELIDVSVTLPSPPQPGRARGVANRSAGVPVLGVDGWVPGASAWTEPISVTPVRLDTGELEVQLGASGGTPLHALWVGGNLQLLVDDGGWLQAVRIGPLLRREWDALS